jgi:hypothetical protein
MAESSNQPPIELRELFQSLKSPKGSWKCLQTKLLALSTLWRDLTVISGFLLCTSPIDLSVIFFLVPESSCSPQVQVAYSNSSTTRLLLLNVRGTNQTDC